MTDDNPFELYEDDRRDEATEAITAVIEKAATEIATAVKTWKSLGAFDTASREALLEFVQEKIVDAFYRR